MCDWRRRRAAEPGIHGPYDQLVIGNDAVQPIQQLSTCRGPVLGGMTSGPLLAYRGDQNRPDAGRQPVKSTASVEEAGKESTLIQTLTLRPSFAKLVSCMPWQISRPPLLARWLCHLTNGKRFSVFAWVLLPSTATIGRGHPGGLRAWDSLSG